MEKLKFENSLFDRAFEGYRLSAELVKEVQVLAHVKAWDISLGMRDFQSAQFLDAQNMLWVATDGGFSVYAGADERYHVVSVKDGAVQDLAIRFLERDGKELQARFIIPVVAIFEEEICFSVDGSLVSGRLDSESGIVTVDHSFPLLQGSEPTGIFAISSDGHFITAVYSVFSGGKSLELVILNYDKLSSSTSTLSLYGDTIPKCVQINKDSFLIVTTGGSKFTTQKDSSKVPENPQESPVDKFFSWTQSREIVHIYYPLPRPAVLDEFEFKYHERSMSLLLCPAEFYETVSLQTKGKGFFQHALFGEINSTASFWTIDDSNTLHLHLEKLHIGTRWPQLFECDLFQVLETLTEADLSHISANLEKYTSSSEAAHPPPSDSTSMHAIADRLNRKRLEELDPANWDDEPPQVDVENPIQKHLMQTEDVDEIQESEECRVFMYSKQDGSLLRTVRSVNDAYMTSHEGHVAFRHVDDMAIFSLDSMEHVASCGALGYVQASKQRKRLSVFSTRPLGSHALIAEREKLVFIYRAPSPGQASSATAIVNLAEFVSTPTILGIRQVSELAWVILTASELIRINLD